MTPNRLPNAGQAATLDGILRALAINAHDLRGNLRVRLKQREETPSVSNTYARRFREL